MLQVKIPAESVEHMMNIDGVPKKLRMTDSCCLSFQVVLLVDNTLPVPPKIERHGWGERDLHPHANSHNICIKKYCGLELYDVLSQAQ